MHPQKTWQHFQQETPCTKQDCGSTTNFEDTGYVFNDIIKVFLFQLFIQKTAKWNLMTLNINPNYTEGLG